MTKTQRNIEILALFDSGIRQKVIAVRYKIGERQVKRIIHNFKSLKKDGNE